VSLSIVALADRFAPPFFDGISREFTTASGPHSLSRMQHRAGSRHDPIMILI
jgi:hypothetical protein